MALRLPGLGFSHRPYRGQATEYIVIQQPLRRVLAMIGRTIDDVVNNPIAKNEVFGYYKVYKMVERQSEVLDLEQQWNRVT